MDRLETIVHESLKIAEKEMQASGHVNPKVVIFYRRENNELGTFMVDLAPQTYFDDRDRIISEVGAYLATKKEDGVRSLDTLIYSGEANMTIDKEHKQVVIASAMDGKGNILTRYKEVQRYMMPDNPEKMFFNLANLELPNFKYTSSLLQNLITSYSR